MAIRRWRSLSPRVSVQRPCPLDRLGGANGIEFAGLQRHSELCLCHAPKSEVHLPAHPRKHLP